MNVTSDTNQFVLDTSVLLSAGKQVLFAYPDAKVIVPLGVVRQLERQVGTTEFGWIARNVLQELERLSKQMDTNVHVETNHIKEQVNRIPASAEDDGNALKVSYNLKQENKDISVTLVTNRLTQRLAAQAIGVNAVSFSAVSLQGEYRGVTPVMVNKEDIDHLYSKGSLPVGAIPDLDEYPVRHAFILSALDASNSTALVVKDERGAVRLIDQSNKGKVQGKTAEQRIALHHLQNPDVDLVSLGGPAGTGKTLLSLFAAVQSVNSNQHNSITVFRPLQEVGGQELGFLPGTEEEKMAPWTLAITDALKVFMHQNEIEQWFRAGKIEVSPATHIRGRTLNNTFIIIDEAQNFERLTLLSLLSRLGENSKCVLSWDAAQRDNLYISKGDGIVAIVDRLKNEPLAAHVTLDKTQRSRAAQLATDILEEMS